MTASSTPTIDTACGTFHWSAAKVSAAGVATPSAGLLEVMFTLTSLDGGAASTTVPV